MTNNGNGTAGAVFTGGSIFGGLAQWASEYSSLISLTLTALSCIGGLTFLYLNWKENKRRNDILEKEQSNK